MEFRVLGPLEVVRDGVPVVLGGPRERAVLCALLVRANEIASVDYLVSAVWEEPPARPEGNLRTYVAGLRKRLGADRLRTRPGGYTVTVSGDELDLTCFEALVSDAEAALDRGDRTAAAACFSRALGLWRGDPLETVRPGPALHGELVRLQERWFSSVERYCDLRFELGGHADVVDELRRLVARYPLREELWARLLTALFGSGRRAEALTQYEEVRRRLAEELGVDPGPRLRELHVAILRGERPDESGPDRSGPARPAQLPVDLPVFAGRETELARLVTACRAGPSGAVVINALDGMAGVGKTALAVHAGHLLAEHYPDGQIFVDLHGNNPDVAPLEPAAALDQLLRALGVPGKDIPPGPDAAAAMYRSLLAGRRLLILLDDAVTERQVQPLLPGTPGCLVLVTSRHRLSGLDTATPLTLDVLPAEDSVTLFTTVACVPDGDDVRDIVELCGHLPLAIRIAAARLRARPGWPPAHLADRLRDERNRLGELTVGERSVAAAFTLSYQHLTTEQQRLFCLLGLHPGIDVDVHAAAALADVDEAAARRHLEELVDVHLLQSPGPGRYRFHDLVRQHAADLARRHESGVDAEQALRRLVDHYVRTAFGGDRLLDRNRRPAELAAPVPGSRPHVFTDVAQTLEWFDREHTSLLAVQRRLAELGRHRDVWLLAWTMDTFHYRCGHDLDQVAGWTLGLAAAERAGDVSGQCHAHRLLGAALTRQRRYGAAEQHLAGALALAESSGDVHDQAHTHWIIVGLRMLQGDNERALEHSGHALRLFEELGNPVWVAHARNGIGWFSARLGHHDEGRRHLTTALAEFRAHGDRQGEAATLSSLGFVDHRTGAHTQALDHYRQALALIRETGNTYTEANMLDQLGQVHAALGDRAAARQAWQEALVLYEKHDRAADATLVRQRLAAPG